MHFGHAEHPSGGRGWVVLAIAMAVLILGSCDPPTADDDPSADGGQNTPDTDPPYVVSIVPGDGEANVGVAAIISITFSEAVECSSAEHGYSLSDASGTVDGSFEWIDQTMNFTASGELSYSTLFDVHVSGRNIVDTAGNRCAEEFTSSFVTEPDTYPPTIELVTPARDEIDVSIKSGVSIRFSEPMNAQSVENSFSLWDGSTYVSGAFDWSSDTMVFAPDSALADLTEYVAKVTTGARDTAENSLAEDFEWRFTPGIVVDISAGAGHTVVRYSGGSLRAWGDNSHGQLGDGTTEGRGFPGVVNGIDSASEMDASSRHTLSLISDGSVVAWGDNQYGQLGDGTNTDRTLPVSVTGITDAIAIAASSPSNVNSYAYHSVAVLSDGSAVAWGSNSYGQLGNGSNTNSNAPVTVTGIDTAVAVAAGGYHTLALLADGTIKAWGRNNIGQLGNGTVDDSNTPVDVSGITTAVAVAAGGYHSLALLADGTIKAWGNGGSGQLGEGFVYTWRWYPVDVYGITTAIAVSAGALHSGAVLADGTVKAWGDNYYYQIGGLGADNYPIPLTVESDALGVATGGHHTVTLHQNSTVKAWGRNDSGQLGGVTGSVYDVVTVDGL